MNHRHPTPDMRVARHAARHHGLLTRAVAIACGLTDQQIRDRVRSGRWERLAPGVYRIAGAPVTDAQRAYAAVLAAHPQAVVCGLSALALLGVGRAPSSPTICVPPSAGSRTLGARLRRSPLEPADRTRVGPTPATTPARALLEAAAVVPDDVLCDFVDAVLCQRLATPSGVLGTIRRAATGRGRTGSVRLRGIVALWLEAIRPGSPAEARLLRRLADWGLPAPVRQHRVELPSGSVALIDLAWLDQRVGLEYDGDRWHTPTRLAADVEREEQLRALGWWIGRVDRHDLAPSSTRVRDELGSRLAVSAAA